MARAGAQALLKERDGDRNGGLSAEEFVGPAPEAPDADAEQKEEEARSRAVQLAQFRVADASGDSRLQEDELVPLLAGEEDDILDVLVRDHMQRLDLDQDGLLTKKE